MRLASFRIPITIAAALVRLFDLAAAVQIYAHGATYLTHVTLTETGPGTVIITAHKIPFTYTDWLVSLALVFCSSGISLSFAKVVERPKLTISA